MTKKTAHDIFREELMKADKRELVELLANFLDLDMRTPATFAESYDGIVKEVGSLVLTKLTGKLISKDMVESYLE